MKTAGKIMLSALGVVGVAGCILLSVLIIPGTPNSTQSLKFDGYIPLPQSTHHGVIAALDYVTINGKHLFVTDMSSGDVYNVSLSLDRAPSVDEVSVFSTKPVPHGIAIDPTTQLAFVSRSETNMVDVFAPDTMRRVSSISVPEGPDGIFYDQIDRLIYVANNDAGLATLIDPATKTKVGVIPLGGRPEYAVFDPQTRLVYQNLEDKDAVAVVDVSQRAVIQRWSVTHCGRPTGAAIDAPERRLFIVCFNTATLVVLDLDTHREVAALPIGRGADSVAYDPELHRLYTAGFTGTMSVIQQVTPDLYRLRDAVHLHVGAHTLAIDPDTHRVYVAYSSLFVRPRLAVFTALR